MPSPRPSLGGIIHYAFSVFIAPMEADLGWTRAQLTGGFSLSLLTMGVMAFRVGWWVDQLGARLLMSGGSIGATLLIIAWSQVADPNTFYLIWIGLGACAAATLYDPAFAVVATWFVSRPGNALVVITFAGGLASTIFVPLTDLLLRAYGWRDAVFALGILLGSTTIPLHVLVLRQKPHQSGHNMEVTDQPSENTRPKDVALKTALHSRFFWLITVAFALSYLSASAIRVHFIPFLVESGTDASTAALASGSIGLMQVVGRVFFAPLDHRLSIHLIMAGIFALQAVAMLLLLVNTSMLIIGLFIVVFGTAYGARTLVRPAILVKSFGVTHYGRISSIMSMCLTLAATIAPYAAGVLYDVSGSYQSTLWLVSALAILAVGVSIIARPQVATVRT